MKALDKTRVRRSFDRQAPFYEETVQVQKRVVLQLAAQLADSADGNLPGRVLDVGAGTGMLLRLLRSLYPDALLVGIDQAAGMSQCGADPWQEKGAVLRLTGDAEHLPFAGGSFGLVVSTSTFQWLNHLEQAFREAMRVLAPGGCFRFALFGGSTLQELKACYREAIREAGRPEEDRTHRFFSVGEVTDALSRAGFADCLVKATVELEHYASVPSLLRSLRRIGAGNASIHGRRGLHSRKVMQRMSELYQQEFGGAQGIPVTYEVIWGAGRKSNAPAVDMFNCRRNTIYF